jgi:pyruvate kinase
MGVARLNFSHSTHKEHKISIDNLRETERAYAFESPIAIALDTMGPEIRTGFLNPKYTKESPCLLPTGSTVRLVVDDIYKEDVTPEHLYVTFKDIVHKVKVDNRIYIDSGLLGLRVTAVGADFVDCVVVNGGPLGSRKGVNLRGVSSGLPAVSDKDRADLRFGVEQKLDMIFASFIRRDQDIKDIRAVLGEDGANIKIIAKIENHEGIENFDSILAEADGVMVARGDLGIEIDPEEVFIAQKMMIAKCNLAGKPVICATQMLESMITNPRPTRAEVTDVGNAVLDGADAVMLSGETANGDHPVEVVDLMSKVCRKAEGAIHYFQFYTQVQMSQTPPLSMDETLCSAAAHAAFFQRARAIVVLTTTGRSVRFLAKYRPPCPILAVSRFEWVARQLRLHRGVFSLYYPHDRLDSDSWQDDVNKRFEWAINSGRRVGFVANGDLVLVIQGWDRGSGKTNTMRIQIVQ